MCKCSGLSNDGLGGGESGDFRPSFASTVGLSGDRHPLYLGGSLDSNAAGGAIHRASLFEIIGLAWGLLAPPREERAESAQRRPRFSGVESRSQRAC